MSDSISRLTLAVVALLVFAAWATVSTVEVLVGRQDQMNSRVFDLSRDYRVQLRTESLQFSNNWNNFLSATVDPYNNGQVDPDAYSSLVDRFLMLDNNSQNFAALSSFYEEVGECVDADLCDFWTARSLFGADVTTFYHNMYPVIIREQQQSGGYDGFLHFVARLQDADRGALHRRFEFHFLRANPDTV
jgi:hypothetical protein